MYKLVCGCYHCLDAQAVTCIQHIAHIQQLGRDIRGGTTWCLHCSQGRCRQEHTTSTQRCHELHLAVAFNAAAGAAIVAVAKWKFHCTLLLTHCTVQNKLCHVNQMYLTTYHAKYTFDDTRQNNWQCSTFNILGKDVQPTILAHCRNKYHTHTRHCSYTVYEVIQQIHTLLMMA